VKKESEEISEKENDDSKAVLVANHAEEVDKLQLQMQKLYKENINKLDKIKAFCQEIEDAKEILTCKEEKIAELKQLLEESNSISGHEYSDSKSILDKFCHSGLSTVFVELFRCKECNKTFPERTELERHVKESHVTKSRMKLLELQANISVQKMKIAMSMNRLKKDEKNQKRKPCKCKRYCKVNNFRRIWKCDPSDFFNIKFQNIVNQSVEHHAEDNDEADRERENGGSDNLYL
jgi:uncharacterized C2H2 Zn-finger protein